MIRGFQPTYIRLNPDYEALLNRAKALGYAVPSAKQQLAQMNMIQQMKLAGIWQKLDVFYVFATDGDKNFACLNWKNPAANQCALTVEPTFTANEGFTGNGSDQYITTNFNPATHGSKYTLDDASRYGYIRTDGSGYIDGVTGGDNRFGVYGENSINRINQGGNNLNAAVDYAGTGMMSIHRTSSTAVACIINKTKLDRTATSTLLRDETQLILRGFTVYSAKQISMYAMGASLVAENDSFVDIFLNYLNSL